MALIDATDLRDNPKEVNTSNQHQLRAAYGYGER